MSKAAVPGSVVFEVLDRHNYVDWSEAIETYLKAQDLWGVVEVLRQPPKIEEDEAQFKAWEKKNAAALHAIKISCGTSTLPYIRGIHEANEAWHRLRRNLTNPPSFPNSFFWLKDIKTLIADEENVDHEFKVAYKDLDDAFSKSNLSAAIELCKKFPLLLTKTLPNDRLVLNELIKLGGRDHDEKVVEILRLVPPDELRNCLSRCPLAVAVRVGAIGIARCLAQMEPELLFSVGALGLTPLAAAIGSHMNEMANMLYDLTPQHFWDDWTSRGYAAMNVITKCFEVENLDIPLKLLKSRPEEFILTKGINGKSPLRTVASAPHLFRRSYHHPFLPKYICEVFGPRLPLGSINFEISGIFVISVSKSLVKRFGS